MKWNNVYNMYTIYKTIHTKSVCRQLFKSLLLSSPLDKGAWECSALTLFNLSFLDLIKTVKESKSMLQKKCHPWDGSFWTVNHHYLTEITLFFFMKAAGSDGCLVHPTWWFPCLLQSMQLRIPWVNGSSSSWGESCLVFLSQVHWSWGNILNWCSWWSGISSTTPSMVMCSFQV